MPTVLNRLKRLTLAILVALVPIFGHSAEPEKALSGIVDRRSYREGAEEIRLDVRFDARKFDSKRAASGLSKHGSIQSVGGKDGGGGDPSDFQRIIVSSRSGVLPNPVLVYATVLYTSEGGLSGRPFGFRDAFAWNLGLLDLNLIADTKVREVFKAMLEDGLLADIRTSPIVHQNGCVAAVRGKKIPRSATAFMNGFSTPVCFDPVAFAEASQGLPSLSILYGLLIHEYAHHYGYLDADHKIATEIALAFERLARKNQEGDALESFANRLLFRMESDAGLKSFWERCTSERNCFSEGQVLRF